MHVKKGDLVVVTTGADKGKKGKVLEAMPKENKVVVEGADDDVGIDWRLAIEYAT